RRWCAPSGTIPLTDAYLQAADASPHGTQPTQVEYARPTAVGLAPHDRRRKRRANDAQGQVNVEDRPPTERIRQISSQRRTEDRTERPAQRINAHPQTTLLRGKDAENDCHGGGGNGSRP